MDEDARRVVAALEAEVGRLAARLAAIKSSFSYRLVAPIRLIERRVRMGRRTPDSAGGRVSPAERSYQAWVERFDTLTPVDAALVRADIVRRSPLPTISIALLPSADAGAVTATVDSLLAQIYRGFEVVALPGTPVPRTTRRALRRRRIALRVVAAPRGLGAAQAAGALLRASRGEYVLALDAGDRLAPLATYHVAATAGGDDRPVLIYGDEDEIGPDGVRTRPFFKPEWDRELALAFDYAGPAVAFRREALCAEGGPSADAGTAWRREMALKLEERQRGPDAAAPPGFRHIPFVLLHRRPVAPDPAGAEAARRVVETALARRGEVASLAIAPGGAVVIRRALPRPAPHVSILVATRDRVELLRRCVDGVLARTRYPSFDVTVIDNGSREPETARYLEVLRTREGVFVVRDDAPFNFSALHNRAVRGVRGDVVVLLNNDTDVIAPEWLERLVAQAVRPDVGAVGAKLYYPDDTIQHAGVFLGPHGTAVHLHAGRGRDDPGPHGLLIAARDLSAVTAACMALRRTVYDEVGGLDEQFAVDFNDVDLCLRIRARGYRIIWEPKAELYHIEAATRGHRHAAADAAGEAGRTRFEREAATFRALWHAAVQADRSYSPNLSVSGLDGAPAFPPRVAKPWTTSGVTPRSAPSVTGITLPTA